MDNKVFKLNVEFVPRLSNGNVNWNARIFFWEKTFSCRIRAMKKFMRMVANMWFLSDNKLRPFCNLRGMLIENPNKSDEKILHSWNWEDKEIRDEWARSPECVAWLDEVTSTPITGVKKERIDSGIVLVDMLFELNLCSSKGDARRKIEEGAIKINNDKVSDVKRQLLTEDFKDSVILISRGKKNKHKLRLEI